MPMLDKRSIREVPSDEIPDCDGIVGGPPCQSWSEAGASNPLSNPPAPVNNDTIFIEVKTAYW
jgi:DNA (cytosine-5)-methyltransferase 1